MLIGRYIIVNLVHKLMETLLNNFRNDRTEHYFYCRKIIMPDRLFILKENQSKVLLLFPYVQSQFFAE